MSSEITFWLIFKLYLTILIDVTKPNLYNKTHKPALSSSAAPFPTGALQQKALCTMAQSRPNASKSSSKGNQAQLRHWSTIPPKFLIYLQQFLFYCLSIAVWVVKCFDICCYIREILTSLFLTYIFFLIRSKTVGFVTFTEIHSQTLHSYVGFSPEHTLKQKALQFFFSWPNFVTFIPHAT